MLDRLHGWAVFNRFITNGFLTTLAPLARLINAGAWMLLGLLNAGAWLAPVYAVALWLMANSAGQFLELHQSLALRTLDYHDLTLNGNSPHACHDLPYSHEKSLLSSREHVVYEKLFNSEPCQFHPAHKIMRRLHLKNVFLNDMQLQRVDENETELST